MKHYFIKEENLIEVKDWLLENIGPENVRWWFTSTNKGSSQKVGDHWVRGTVLWLDITEEEEANLTWFNLRWA